MSEQPGDPEVLLDCRGMICPLPIIELGRAFAGTGVGQVIRLLSDDPAADVDVAAWCRMRGQQLVSQTAYASVRDAKPATAYRIRHV